MALAPYVYDVLPDKYFRVLVLSSPNEALSGHLETIPLPTRRWKSSLGYRFRHRTTHYCALSYTWGPEHPTFDFICNSQTLKIRSNLLSFLKRWHQRQQSDPIWIDAICINQDDQAIEKSKQIQLMPLIYQQAQKVWVWLGEETVEGSNAASNIPITMKALKNGTLDSSQLNRNSIQNLSGIICSPWFTRLWTLQEATIPKSLTFVYGSHTFEWQLLQEFAALLEKANLTHLYRDSSPVPPNGFTELRNIATVKGFYGTHRVDYIPNIILIARERECKDPRDRIWGIMGLMGRDMRDSYSYDPDDGEVDLYTGFTAIALLQDPFLLMLSLVEQTYRLSGLPGWCPDYHRAPDTAILGNFGGYNAGFRIHTAAQIRWDPVKSQEVQVRAIQVGQVDCVVNGTWADTFRLARRRPVNLDPSKGNDLLHWVERCLAAYSSYHDGTERAHKPSGVLEECAETFVGEQFRKEKGTGCSRATHLGNVMAYLRNSDSTKLKDAQTVQYLALMDSVCSGRKCFVTSEGRVGMGPLQIKDGDVVCVFKGASVPFVLRRLPGCSERYSFVGEAYLYGVMRGEALKSKKVWKWVTLE